MPSLAIPAEIVGDTETIRARRDDVDRDLLSAAICLGHQTSSADFHLAHIIELTARRDVLEAECDRRWVARDLAYADEPARQFAQCYVRGAR
jgi:hypothetical protein